MRSKKRWLASILAMAVAFGDCGGMMAAAAESAITVEDSISENNLLPNETPGTDPAVEGTAALPEAENVAAETAALPETENAAAETAVWPDTVNTAEPGDTDIELPALHIGQIPGGAELPAADGTFLYDCPLSFETEKTLILFTNYAIDEVPDAAKAGTLEWSILRGEKGLPSGSANLLDVPDDWNGFETVTAAPYFTMEEIPDTESEYDQMMALTAREAAFAAADNAGDETVKTPEAYDYYIRAAYYPAAGSGKDETFYAASTIPVIVPNTTDEAPDGANADASETEQSQETAADSISGNDVPDQVSVSENTVDGAETEITDQTPPEEDMNRTPEETAAQEPVTEEDALQQTSADSVSENSVTNQAADPSAAPFADAEETSPVKESVGVLTLDAESVTLHPAPAPDAKFLVTAAVEPKDITTPIIWSSSDDTIAMAAVPGTESAQENDGISEPTPAVSGKTVEITALKEGTATITATCGDQKASVHITVVPKDDDEVYDLSGDLWVDGFQQESGAFVYTGQKITQDFRVYHKETLLKEKTDYTLTYKNNVNAAAWNTAKAPSVTINMKGQYSGSITLYFTILQKDISKIDPNPANANDPALADSPGYEQMVNYAKNLNIPAPVLTYNRKKLAVNKDFICDYAQLPSDYKKGDSYDLGRQYSYTVIGKGNFTGSLPMRLVVLDKKQNFNTASVTLNAKKYAYHGIPLTKTDVTITKLKIGSTELDPSLYDYDVFHTNGLQGAYINVYPTEVGEDEGYHGSKQINLKLEADRTINKAAFIEANWQTSIPFSQKVLTEKGGMFQENKTLLTYTDETGKTDTLVEDTDYTMKYSNAQKVGKVTVTFTGKGRYKGSLKKTYQITANTEKSHFTYQWKNVTKNGNGKLTVSYQKNGAIPEFVLRDQDQNVLKIKTDYKVTYKNNKIPKDAETGEMTLEITGVGNYKGYKESISLTVTRANIANAALTVADKPYSARKNAWKSAVTITDVNGKKLAAGTDYEKTLSYHYEGYDGNENSVPSIGTTVTVKVTGCGSYQGEISGTYRIFDSQKNISKLQVVIDPQEYTGKEVTLKPADIHIYANAADKKNEIELPDQTSCYEIVGYKNNIKAGNAKVTLRGRGDYGGTKTCSFKIQKKAYRKNSVDKITLDKNKLSFSLLDTKPESRTLTATLTPKDPTQMITNPTVIWTTSNSDIATVEVWEDSGSEENNTTQAETVRVVINARKQGTVTVTAIAQDGNKRAQCNVTITLPTLTQKGKTIEGTVGDTYQLTFVGYEDPEHPMDMEGIAFTSSKPNIASVDETGKITMKKIGPATIKVSMGNGQYVQQCYVVVAGGEIDTENDPRVLTYHQAEGCKDDTQAINDLLQKWENEVRYQHQDNYDYLYIPAGEYHINPAANPGFTAGIMLRDGQSLIMSPDAKLYAIGTNSGIYRMIYASDRKDIYISGGKLIGERDAHKGSGGEAGHGIEIVGCTNVHIRYVEVSKCWGDGIYLGRISSGKNSNGVTIANCNLHHNRRSNLSITDVSNVKVQNCQFNNANGTAPQYGIDIEPNSGQTCQNVTISNCSFKGNAGGTIQILGQLNGHIKNVTIENCVGDKAPVKWSGFGGSVSGVTERNNKWG